MWEDLLKAVCLMLVLEGMLPFVSPGRWRQIVLSVAHIRDGHLRTAGLISMLSGVGLLYFLF